MESKDAIVVEELTLETLPVDVITVVFNYLHADDIFTFVAALEFSFCSDFVAPTFFNGF
jgi:hypothetical protein